MNRMNVSKIAAKDASQIEALGEARESGGEVPFGAHLVLAEILRDHYGPLSSVPRIDHVNR